MIGTLARRCAGSDVDVVIVSSDKDMLQLVTERVSMYNPMKDDTWYDPAKVTGVHGREARQVADLLALKGDASTTSPARPASGTRARAT